MQIDAVPDALWRRVSELIAQHTGLDFPRERRPDLQRGLAAAAAEFGLPDAAGCAEWLLSGSPTQAQLHILASHLTIGETYFFRERKAFDALAEHVLPELIRRRRGREQRLRLWSAACSTGEEPYSLAILVRQLLPDWRDWSVSILATDINERFLERAAAGIYAEWSFRESAAGFKERYFTASNGRFAIAPEIRNCVSFAQLNLAQDCLLSPSADTRSMDIILCRNVLIYFTASHARKLAENLHRALAEGGWLAVSPSECSQTLFSSFAAENFPGTILYRKSKAEERGRPIGPAPAPAPADAVAEQVAAFDPPQLPRSRAPDRDSKTAGPPPPSAAPDAQDSVSPPPVQTPEAISLQTRALAGQGRHADALASSEQWIASDKMDASAHYVHAMILQEMGERRAARDSLHRAVYLKPDFALAHFALGNLARAETRTAQAGKHFTNALHLLRSWPPDALPPESDGMSAGRLVEIISTLLTQPERPVSPAEAAPNE